MLLSGSDSTRMTVRELKVIQVRYSTEFCHFVVLAGQIRYTNVMLLNVVVFSGINLNLNLSHESCIFLKKVKKGQTISTESQCS